MLNYEGIAKTCAESIIEEIQEELKSDNPVYHTARIFIDAGNNILTVEVMRKDPLGIEYNHVIETELKPNNTTNAA
jgi:hypothetical protein